MAWDKELEKVVPFQRWILLHKLSSERKTVIGMDWPRGGLYGENRV
jgi:hypothetical protein